MKSKRKMKVCIPKFSRVQKESPSDAIDVWFLNFFMHKWDSFFSVCNILRKY